LFREDTPWNIEEKDGISGGEPLEHSEDKGLSSIVLLALSIASNASMKDRRGFDGERKVVKGKDDIKAICI